jgi:hypothetical protein
MALELLLIVGTLCGLGVGFGRGVRCLRRLPSAYTLHRSAGLTPYTAKPGQPRPESGRTVYKRINGASVH